MAASKVGLDAAPEGVRHNSFCSQQQKPGLSYSKYHVPPGMVEKEKKQIVSGI